MDDSCQPHELELHPSMQIERTTEDGWISLLLLADVTSPDGWKKWICDIDLISIWVVYGTYGTWAIINQACVERTWGEKSTLWSTKCLARSFFLDGIVVLDASILLLQTSCLWLNNKLWDTWWCCVHLSRGCRVMVFGILLFKLCLWCWERVILACYELLL
jgi:hypothetical protein